MRDKNEIGKIFGKHNLLEYKSPDTALNYDVFLKGIAYAYLYKVNETYVDEILLEEITLSFIRERKPVKLFKKLQIEKFQVEEKWKGIYYINKDGFIRIQVIVSKELDIENHIWLNSLSQKISMEQAVKLLKTTQQLQWMDDKNYADSLWEVVASVNEDTVLEMRRDEHMCEALARIMKPELDEAFSRGMCENIFSLLEDLGEIPDNIRNGILAETDVSKLKMWNKIAARAGSIEEFWEKIQK